MSDVDLQRMIDMAVSFFLAGERCNSEFSFGEYPTHSVSAPMITNYAFSIELALKILHRKANIKTSGHSLKKLYQKLPDEHKPYLMFLEDVLDEIDECFIDWRYAFEKDILIAFPDTLRRSFIVCHTEIRRTNPSLLSIYESNWGAFEPEWDFSEWSG